MTGICVFFRLCPKGLESQGDFFIVAQIPPPDHNETSVYDTAMAQTRGTPI